MNESLRLPGCLLRIKDDIWSEKRLLALSFASVFFWGLLAHAYGFLHNSLSHDVLNAFAATKTEELWKVELGRFLVPLYRAFFRNQISLPWLIGLLGLTWTAMAVFLVNRIFSVRSTWLAFLIAGIMTTNITYIAQIATYVYEFDFNACSLLLAVAAAYLWEKDRSLLVYLFGSLCLTLSIGIYQAFLSVTVTLIIWKSVMDLLDGQEEKDVFIHGLKGIFMILLGGLFYYLLSKCIYTFTDIPQQSRTDVFNFGGMNPLLLLLYLIKPSLRFLNETLLHDVYSEGFLNIAVVLITCACIIAAILLFRAKKYRFPRIALICLLVFATPFAMICMFFLARGRGVHELMIYALCFFYVFILLFTCRLAEPDMFPGWKAGLLKLFSLLLVCSILWQNVVTANTAYVKKEMEANATLSLMTRVVTMLEEQEEYVYNETPVALIGKASETDSIYGSVRSLVGMKGPFSITNDNSFYYFNCYKAYFDYVLQYPLQYCDDETHAALKEDPRVTAMKAFPQDGCMELIDGVMVVKMG